MKEKLFNVAKTFGLSGPQSLTMRGYEHDPSEQDPHLVYLRDRVPKPTPGYQFRPEMMRDYRVWVNSGKRGLYMFGPTQCGKSSFILEVAARLGIPVFRITGDADTELHNIFGHYVLGENGQMNYVYGPGAEAAIHGGIFLFDEIDRIQSGVMVGMNGLFERKPFTLTGKGGEVVIPNPNFLPIATGNTNMAGDESGNYNTAMIHDKSCCERFDMTLSVGYPTDLEERLLHNLLKAKNVEDELLQYWFEQEGIQVSTDTGVKKGSSLTRDDFIRGVLQVRDMIRKQSRDCGNMAANALERTMSVNTLETWLHYCVEFVGAPNFGRSALHYSMERALTNMCTPSTKIAVHEMVTSVFGVKPELG